MDQYILCRRLFVASSNNKIPVFFGQKAKMFQI